MNAALELKQRQAQGLVLTPQMRQSLQMLQMSCTELKEFLEKEMTENPLLEVDERTGKSFGAEDMQSISWGSYLQNCASSNRRMCGRDSTDEEEFTFEKYTHSERTYRELLDMQMELCRKRLTPRQYRIGCGILDRINDDGYLLEDTEDLAISLAANPEEVEEMIEEIQSFYPAGTGARSVSECLYLQLREEGEVSKEYRTLLDCCLEDIAEQRNRKIERETGISLRIQQQFYEKIRTLHPRPGSRFAPAEKTYYVVPDGCISWNEGVLHVQLNRLGTPALMINPVYRKLLASKECTPQTREYIQERMNRAAVILHNVEARGNTIRSIAAAVAEVQKAYLLGESSTLQALTQKQVAEKTGLHESTVSRTVRGKYFRTPRGTMELQALFCSGYTQGDQVVAVDAVKEKIRDMIQLEEPEHPLADQKIADFLSKEFAPVARRTVAKYREEMGIAPSSKRRKRAGEFHN